MTRYKIPPSRMRIRHLPPIGKSFYRRWYVGHDMDGNALMWSFMRSHPRLSIWVSTEEIT